MTATNHALTGAIIGLVIGEPLIALPAAFLSHFVCDAIPHFGMTGDNDTWLKTKAFRNMIIVDAILCFILVVFLALTHPRNWILAAFCAFLASSPDLFSINRYRSLKIHKPWHPNLYSRFASAIQWFERPIGSVVEVAWFAGCLVILTTFIRG